MIQSQHSNVQVSIFVTCLNFAGTGSRILLNPVSSCHRVIPSRKISLNFNGEISYRELAWRPWDKVGMDEVGLDEMVMEELTFG